MTEENFIRANAIRIEIEDIKRDLGCIKQEWNSTNPVIIKITSVRMDSKYSRISCDSLCEQYIKDLETALEKLEKEFNGL